MARNRHTEKRKKATGATQVIGLVLCLIFGLMLISNLTIIIKGALNPDAPPAVLGITPLAVQSGSMSGNAPDHIEVGDLIFVRPVDTDKLQAGDIIAFLQGKIVVTHRIVRVETTEKGATQFITKGDANNTEDSIPVHPEAVLGKYTGRIPKLGDLVLFMQQPIGMALFIGLPVLACVLLDSAARRKEVAAQRRQAEKLQRERARLQAESGCED